MLLHSSKLLVLPSSQNSPCWISPSPQTGRMQLFEQASSSTALASSHSSPCWISPSPHTPGTHTFEHASSSTVLPSSQSSTSVWTMPSPHAAFLQPLVHTSPSSWLPSSQSSPASTTPSPQTGAGAVVAGSPLLPLVLSLALASVVPPDVVSLAVVGSVSPSEVGAVVVVIAVVAAVSLENVVTRPPSSPQPTTNRIADNPIHPCIVRMGGWYTPTTAPRRIIARVGPQCLRTREALRAQANTRCTRRHLSAARCRPGKRWHALTRAPPCAPPERRRPMPAPARGSPPLHPPPPPTRSAAAPTAAPAAPPAPS